MLLYWQHGNAQARCRCKGPAAPLNPRIERLRVDDTRRLSLHRSASSGVNYGVIDAKSLPFCEQLCRGIGPEVRHLAVEDVDVGRCYGA